QLARWEEEGWVAVERVTAGPFDSFSERFLAAASSGDHDLILVSQVLFGSGQVFDRIDELAELGKAEGPWVVIDGYHASMAVAEPFGARAARSAFYLAGGYKYAMSGEGCAFLHAPEGYGPRPPVTGWFAEYDDLALPPGTIGYPPDARRFLGATFDPPASTGSTPCSACCGRTASPLSGFPSMLDGCSIGCSNGSPRLRSGRRKSSTRSTPPRTRASS